MAPVSLISSPIPDDTDVDIPEMFAKFLHFVSMAYSKIVVAHPYIFGFVLIMWSYHPSAPFQAIAFIIWTLPKKMFIALLRCVGFSEEGVQPDSYASRYQALHYEGYIPEDSLFAQYQSYGALGDSTHNATQHNEEPHPSPWWTIFGWLLYFAGFGAMLFYGSLKGI